MLCLLVHVPGDIRHLFSALGIDFPERCCLAPHAFLPGWVAW